RHRRYATTPPTARFRTVLTRDHRGLLVLVQLGDGGVDPATESALEDLADAHERTIPPEANLKPRSTPAASEQQRGVAGEVDDRGGEGADDQGERQGGG